MSLLQCDWAASPCSGREQQGTVTGGPSSGQPRVRAPPHPPAVWALALYSPLAAPSSPLVPPVRHQFAPTKAQRRALAGEPVMSVPGLFPSRGGAGRVAPPLARGWGGGKQLAQHAQQTGAGPTVSPARGGGIHRQLPRWTPAWLFLRAGFLGASSLEGCAGTPPARRWGAPRQRDTPCARRKPFWYIVGLSEPGGDPSSIVGAGGVGSEVQGISAAPWPPARPSIPGGGCHLILSPQWWAGFVPGISHAWAPHPHAIPARHPEGC